MTTQNGQLGLLNREHQHLANKEALKLIEKNSCIRCQVYKHDPNELTDKRLCFDCSDETMITIDDISPLYDDTPLPDDHIPLTTEELAAAWYTHTEIAQMVLEDTRQKLDAILIRIRGDMRRIKFNERLGTHTDGPDAASDSPTDARQETLGSSDTTEAEPVAKVPTRHCPLHGGFAA